MATPQPQSELTKGNVQAQNAGGQRPSSDTSRGTSLTVVGNKFRVGRKIGEGSFGIIYEGVNMVNNQKVAIKFEPRKSDAPQLRDEYRTYQIMSNTPGIPSVHHFGVESVYNVLVLDLLGPSLEDLFELCQRNFTIKTVCMLAKQMLARIQSTHEKNLIYRDIKPDNFLIGRNNNATTVYLIDFGMAKYYRDPHTKQHIPYREKKSLSGTARYMSINTHLGREQSRRDDLESLGHVFFYFLRGQLPWQGLKAATNKQKYEKIGEKKQLVPISELCKGHPEEFGKFLAYSRGLKFEETPDYDYLYKLINLVMKKNNLIDDGQYDWMKLENPQKKSSDQAASKPKEGESAQPKSPNNSSPNNGAANPNNANNNVNSTSADKGAGAATSGAAVTSGMGAGASPGQNHDIQKTEEETTVTCFCFRRHR